ncbi:hypothetical protein PRZ48_010715 [Zasmidium cellare]|uniref:F-box domain-containing protein n=1 Tax=Zasmidium cellare TaxID=395010 RepID=A0ABR0E9R3_ZASCE|nr:hypothetical protein PRZ48_010715 [Zasmidium cellare]
MAPTQASAASYGRVEYSPREHTKSWRETTCLFMVPRDELIETEALEMVEQLREMTKNPEQRVPRLRHHAQRSRRPTAPRGIFPFLDLPAEIRNKIYRYILPRLSIQRLRCFTTPALSRVCQQLRHETLAVFFYLNTFVAEVKSSFSGCSNPASGMGKPCYIESNGSLFQWLGRLGIAEDVNPLSWVYYANTAFFRNIDIVLLNPNDSSAGEAKHEPAVLSFRSGPLVRISFHVGVDKGCSILECYYIRELLKRAQKVMLRHSRKTGPQGLSFQSLQAVAAVFRFKQGERLIVKSVAKRPQKAVHEAPAESAQ